MSFLQVRYQDGARRVTVMLKDPVLKSATIEGVQLDEVGPGWEGWHEIEPVEIDRATIVFQYWMVDQDGKLVLHPATPLASSPWGRYCGECGNPGGEFGPCPCPDPACDKRVCEGCAAHLATGGEHVEPF